MSGGDPKKKRGVSLTLSPKRGEERTIPQEKGVFRGESNGASEKRPRGLAPSFNGRRGIKKDPTGPGEKGRGQLQEKEEPAGHCVSQRKRLYSGKKKKGQPFEGSVSSMENPVQDNKKNSGKSRKSPKTRT